MDYIIEDTRHLISAFEDHVSKKDYDVFSKYDKFIEKITKELAKDKNE